MEEAEGHAEAGSKSLKGVVGKCYELEGDVRDMEGEYKAMRDRLEGRLVKAEVYIGEVKDELNR